jgi:predicted 3-demethylubiquinone-9 3-methyltransferase (glyoxalase superfamily)
MKKTKEKSQKMLAYSKNVLSKMSFDVLLFRKELSKAYQNLLEDEIEELMNWVNDQFGPSYVLKPVLIEKK